MKLNLIFQFHLISPGNLSKKAIFEGKCTRLFNHFTQLIFSLLSDSSLSFQTIQKFLQTTAAIIYFYLFPTWYTVFPSTYNICYPLSSTCFRPHRPIIRRSKLYMQGENTIGCMYNLDLLMMGLWGLKYVEERG